MSLNGQSSATTTAKAVRADHSSTVIGEGWEIQVALFANFDIFLASIDKIEDNTTQQMCKQLLALAVKADEAGYYEFRKQLGKQRMKEEQRGPIDKYRDQEDAEKAIK